MNINPMQLLQALNTNPQQFVKQALGNNPMVNNLMNLISNKDAKGLEEMARNMAKEKGIDADKLYNTYKQKLGV